MSAIAPLWNVPGNEREANDWSFAHMAHHRDILSSIYQLTGKNYSEFSLDPLPLNNFGGWIYQHQQMHNDMTSVLGINSGLNLTNIDWADDSARAAFIFANATEHTLIEDRLFRIQNTPGTTPVVATYTGFASSSAFNTSYSFGGVNIGTPAADRYIVCCVSWQGAASSVTGISINGTPMSGLVGYISNNFVASAIFMAHVPSAATATISIVLGPLASFGCAVAAYAVTGLNSVGASQVTYSGASSPSATLSASSGGCVIGVAHFTGFSGSLTTSWSGATADSAAVYALGQKITTGSQNFASGVAAYTVQCIAGASASQPSGSFAVFNPPT